MFDYEKYVALGNDYVIIDPNYSDVTLNEDNIRLICNRNHGIGSDGILYGPFLKNDEFHLRIFNPDGSECEKSGNGLRMFSRYLYENNYTTKEHFIVHTLSGPVSVNVIDKKSGLIKIGMGKYSFDSDKLNIEGNNREVINEQINIDNEKYTFTGVYIGNPHCVIFNTDITADLAKTLGPKISIHSMFKKRTNVQFVNVLDKNNIQIEIWERGAGYTLASGSSSCAAATAAYKLGYVSNEVTVHMPGGKIDIELMSDHEIFMTGLANTVSKGAFTQEFRSRLVA